jgi:hypothetical protein
VTAKSGLQERTEPYINSRTVDLLPFKTKVNVLNKTNRKMTLNDAGQQIKGHWVRINHKSQFHGYATYVFDGFLSKTKP